MEGNGVRAARLRGYLAADSSNTELACELSDELVSLGEFEEAESVLASLPASLQAVVSIEFRRARLAMMAGRYAEALAVLEALETGSPNDLAISHDRAFCHLCLRETQHARGIVEAALNTHGAVPSLLVLGGRIGLAEQQYPQALDYLQHAVTLDPNDAQAAGVLALALFDSSNFNAAGNAAENALKLDPDQHEALLVAATLALWQRQWDVAQALYERALQRHANSGRALSGLGQSLMLRNDLPTAHAVLSRATRAMPEHIGTWHALAWSQLLQGDAQGAHASYQQAYAVDRNFGDTHGGLALVAVLRGDDAGAEQSIERALRLDRNSITARYARSLLLQNRRDTEASEALLSELIQAGGLPAVPVAEFAQRLRQTLSPP